MHVCMYACMRVCMYVCMYYAYTVASASCSHRDQVLLPYQHHHPVHLAFCFALHYQSRRSHCCCCYSKTFYAYVFPSSSLICSSCSSSPAVNPCKRNHPLESFGTFCFVPDSAMCGQGICKKSQNQYGY